MKKTYKKLYYLTSAALGIFLIGNVSAQTSYTWSGNGDGTTWDDPNNWVDDVVPLTSAYDITIDPVTSTLPVVIGASDAVQVSDNMFGPEWGQTLDVYGSLTSSLFLTPVGALGGPASTVNLYGNGSISAADTFFIGDPFWVNGATIPDVNVNLYDNSSLTANYIGMAGHLSIYGGTVTANLGFLTGTATSGPWNPGPSTTDATRLINVAGGKLVIGGDASTQTTDLITRGILEGDGVVGNVFVDTISDPGFTIITAVPEPASVALLGLSGFVLLLRRRLVS